MANQPATPRPSLSAAGIVARDLGASLAFYRLLGLGIPRDADTEPHVEVTLPGGVRLMWDPVSTVLEFEPSWTFPSRGRGISLAFDCGSPAGVDGTWRQLTDAGASTVHPPWDAPWGQRYATVLDPDGNGVDLFAAAG